MKYRYGYDNAGKIKRIAKVYSKQEHNIDYRLIDIHARRIVNTLISNGYQAYIVGGAIRDILLNNIPKDFDIVTNAHPTKIKNLFRYSKIIGKRFRIVLVPTHKSSFIEVTTFRNNTHKHNEPGNSVFGSIDQDVQRRDFTCNALYYNPIKEELIDYVNAITHIKKRKLIPIRTHFEEDPVRMLRTIKFSEKCNLHVPLWLLARVQKNAHFISHVSRSRMTEEIIKILVCGHSAQIFHRCYKKKLLFFIMPTVAFWLKEKPKQTPLSSDGVKEPRLTTFLKYLAYNDSLSLQTRTRSTGIKSFIKVFVENYMYQQKKDGHKLSIKKTVSVATHWIQPITPANIEIQKAVISLMPQSHSTVQKKPQSKKIKKNKIL